MVHTIYMCRKNYIVFEPGYLLTMHCFFPDFLVGFSSKKYTTTESQGQVSICVGMVNSNVSHPHYTVVLLPDEGKLQCLIFSSLFHRIVISNDSYSSSIIPICIYRAQAFLNMH